MSITQANLIGALWIAWAVYWFVAARTAKQDHRRESLASMASHVVPLFVAAWLLWARHFSDGFLTDRFLPLSPATFYSGIAVLAFGLGFSIWARHVLGRNWSGIVTVKQDHELVRSGPYRYVRHPIYTGLVVAFAGTAIARGEWRGVLAVLIVFVSFWIKLKHEERWMIETFGDAYLRYRDEVRAIIPFVL